MANSVELAVFTLDATRFAIELRYIEQVVRSVEVCPLPGAPQVVAGAIDVHGQLLPLFDIRGRLGLPRRAMTLNNHLILARTKRRPLALLVDRVEEIVSIPGEAVVGARELCAGMKYVDGAASIDGSIVLIHDLESFLDEDEVILLDEALNRHAGADSAR